MEGQPHHITQRGNARQVVFDDARDHRVYLKLLREYAREYGLRVWAWCLMSNHVHLLAVPKRSDALARAFGRTHCDYARYRNAQMARCGHLWQARYYSCPIEASAVWPVMAYIERNPVRAGIVELAEHYPWSSARCHVSGWDETGFLNMAEWRENYTSERWRETLRTSVDEEAFQERLRLATFTGRPFGSGEFVEDLEKSSNRRLRPGRPGRPRKAGVEGEQLALGNR